LPSAGLSPLARGTPGFFFSAPVRVRFIPAGAGNSNDPKFGLQNQSVYPRWRGELGLKDRITVLEGGLSPLARGTHEMQEREFLVRRFIPAGAGNSG